MTNPWPSLAYLKQRIPSPSYGALKFLLGSDGKVDL